jgi:hypothetical protein
MDEYLKFNADVFRRAIEAIEKTYALSPPRA